MSDRPATAFLPKEFRFWPDDAVNLDAGDIQKHYESGCAGAYNDPAQHDAFVMFAGADAYGVTNRYGLAGAGEGRLVIPFQYVLKHFPGCWPGPAQQRGDCVSHSTKNAALVTLACDIESGKPDEVTGVVEGVPEVDPEGISQGVLSSEGIYWYRGYSGDGWSCEAAARVACQDSALWLRNDYPELGVDLRKYSGSLAGKYGRSKPPSEFTEYGRKHLMRSATEGNSADEVRDLLANGFGWTTCGGEGYSSSRDENGVSVRKGSWAHAMACIGFDDRAEIKQKYGEPLALILNSWGKWNSGGRKILGTDIEIPEGSFWARWSHVKNRTFIALSGANGWPSRAPQLHDHKFW